MSEIGFGAWGIGGAADALPTYGPSNDHESKQAIRRAFDLGVKLYNTAELYGYGHSERLIGAVFRGVRAEAIIATKAGLLDSSGAQDFTAQHLQESLKGSLRPLRTDYVDLFQLHSPPTDLLREQPGILSLLQSL